MAHNVSAIQLSLSLLIFALGVVPFFSFFKSYTRKFDERKIKGG